MTGLSVGWREEKIVPFEKELEELKRRTEKDLEMGGPKKVKRQHDQGKLTARERIAGLLYPQTFHIMP